MRRNNTSDFRILCALIVVTICAGCATSYSDLSANAENYVDLSDPAAGKAQIRAARWDIGIAGIYCYMTTPARAERVSVSAGTVDVSVVCETRAIGEGSWVRAAFFSFDALTGHHYVITTRTCDACVKLTDETSGQVVAEFPEYSFNKVGKNYRYAGRQGSEEDLSTGDHTATIWGGNCRLLKGEVSSLVVDAGLIDIDVTCTIPRWVEIPSRERVTSSFAFDAEAGHTYEFRREPLREECISLFDTTSLYIFESTPISCEPYEKVE
jgi:hypothetical protein